MFETCEISVLYVKNLVIGNFLYLSLMQSLYIRIILHWSRHFLTHLYVHSVNLSSHERIFQNLKENVGYLKFRMDFKIVSTKRNLLFLHFLFHKFFASTLITALFAQVEILFSIGFCF